MQATVEVHEHTGRSLSLEIQGADRDAVIDAFWNGLKRPGVAGMLAVGCCDIGERTDGSILIRFEPAENAKIGDILFEMRIQLKNPVRASA